MDYAGQEALRTFEAYLATSVQYNKLRDLDYCRSQANFLDRTNRISYSEFENLLRRIELAREQIQRNK